ncbi:MAG: PAS domain S-box protein [Prolixibacteraceae bacterium]|nr:PAS domain S-box protein [Prolixibacteraceae bacterium]
MIHCTMQEHLLLEEHRVKNKLVNVALVVASLVGLPLVAASVIRANIFQDILFLAAHVSMYLMVLVVMLLRHQLTYRWRAYTIIFIIFLVAIVDFVKTGFISIGFLWMTTAVVLCVLFFNFKRGLYCLGFGLLIIFSIAFLDKTHVITYDLDYQYYAREPIIVVIRTFAYLITSLIIIFSIRQIYNTLNDSNTLLSIQKADLIKSTERLKQEMEVRIQSEKQALDNEYKFKSIFELSTDPIAVVDLQGRIIDFNHSFMELSKREAADLSMIHYLSIMPEEYHEYFLTYNNRLKELPGRFELRYHNRSGKAMYLDVSLSIIHYPSGEALLAVFRDYTERIYNDRAIYSAVLEAEERERLNLSKELHDGLGPLLSTLKIYFEVLEKRPGDPEIHQRINNTLAESIKGVKAISNNLSPYILQNLGVTKALQGFINNVTIGDFPKVTMESNMTERLSEKVEITVYRLVTELLNNTLKHAQARHVFIELLMEDEVLTIRYTDDGKGFDTESNEKMHNGIGLFNIKSRIEKFGGTIHIDSKKDQGFRFLATMNVNEIT